MTPAAEVIAFQPFRPRRGKLRRLLLAIAMMLALAAPAFALADGEYRVKCAGFKSNPPEAIDRDPVVTTEIYVSEDPEERAAARQVKEGTVTKFDVTHITLKGEEHSRAEQYRDIRLWTDRKDRWSWVWHIDQKSASDHDRRSRV
jgi:hypothetical protein